jgi:hypothetical protein
LNWTDKEEVRRYFREYRQRNREKTIQLQGEWRKKNPAKTMVSSAKKRAKLKGIPFSITYEDVVVPDVCPILNIPLRVNQTGETYTKNSPTLDRIVPELGYVSGNIQCISHLANVMKNCATREELLTFADWVQKTYGTMD